VLGGVRRVRWPSGYSGVRLASSQIAVVDDTGYVAAVTGRRYRLDGNMLMSAAIGGSLFGKAWFTSFDVCRP